MVKALYFPGLRPDEDWVGALRPLVERLVVYAVVEDEPTDTGVSVPWGVREVMPLGSDRSRFVALFREMTGRDAAVLRGQLLAMASRPGRDRDEATVGSLSGVLHRLGEGGDAENLEKARTERIWQARLFLKLAEMVMASEFEVVLGLAAVASRQADMMKALQGSDDEDGVDELPPAVSRPFRVPRKSFRTRDQLAAWAVFYLRDSGPEALLLTDDPEAAALLADEVEKIAPGWGIALPDLLLPGDGVGLAPVASALADMVQGKIEDGKAAMLAVAAGQRGSRAASAAASMSLRLQLLPGAELHQVMVALSGLPGESGVTAPTTPYVLVGVVGPE